MGIFCGAAKPITRVRVIGVRSTSERFVQCDFHDGVSADRRKNEHENERVGGDHLPLEDIGPNQNDFAIDVESVEDSANCAPHGHDDKGTNNERDDGRHNGVLS